MNKHLTIAALLTAMCMGVFAADETPEQTSSAVVTLDAEDADEASVDAACPYSALNGKKGNDIRTALHAIIKDHKVLSYNNVWASATDADDRGDGTNNIWDMYTSCTFSKWDKCGSGESTEECECYNREHSLPKSWWGGDTSEPMYTDLHHVIPTDRFANEKRSAWPLGEVTNVIWTSSNGSKEGYGTFGSSGNNETFEPADEYKGDFARIYFYMATCYMDKNFTAGGKGYKVFSSGSANFVTTALNLYLKWHRNDPVSDKERKRNNAVEKKQGNRNPFVDEPDLVEYIWGNKKTVVYNCGNSAVEAVDADGQQSSVKKIIRDGQLLIIRGEEVYTVMGERAK